MTIVTRPSHPEGPLKEYYLRESKNEPLFGPLTFFQADNQAREASKLNKSGVMEMVVLLGTRKAEPVRAPPVVSVIGIYFRGRLTISGPLAQYNSDHSTFFPGLG